MKKNTTSQEHKQAALQVEQLFNNSPGTPDWLTNALMAALTETAKIKDIKIWKEDEATGTEDFDLEGLARLFAESQTLSLQPEELESVTVTLPNGKQVELYGDAAEMAREPLDDQARVAHALYDLYHNPQTPTQLWEALGEFVCEAMNDTGHVVQHREPFLLDLIKAVDDPMSRRIAEREERERREAN